MPSLPHNLSKLLLHFTETSRCLFEDARLANTADIVTLLHADGGDLARYQGMGDHAAIDHAYVEGVLFPHFANQLQHNREANFFLSKKCDDGTKGDMIGFLVLWNDEENRLRTSPYLLPSHRGQGLGHEIYREAIQPVYRQLGEKEIYAKVSSGQLPMLRIMAQYGGKTVGESPIPEHVLHLPEYHGKVLQHISIPVKPCHDGR